MSINPPTSHLFYQTRLRRPVLDRAEGVYLWDRSGKQYLDGSSGAMVCNIGHSNPRVLAAMRAQMDKSTFGYRLVVGDLAAALAGNCGRVGWQLFILRHRQRGRVV